MATQLVPREGQADLPPEPLQPEDGENKVMGFFDHIDELRMRIVRSVIAIGLGMIVALLFTNDVIKYLMLEYGQRLQILNPTGTVTIFIRVAFMLGAILAIPVITYHVFMYIIPALTRRERRWVFMALPGTTFLFIFGLLFTWFLLVPLYINFLKNFQSDIFDVSWTAEEYITFVTSVVFWHGVAFETPLVFFVLARMGLVTAGTMIKYWRQAIVGAAVLAAVITPTVDPVTMGVIMGVLLGLYVASIFLVAIAQRINRRRVGALPT
jgi:sec-independent protein translocase protein TatC